MILKSGKLLSEDKQNNTQIYINYICQLKGGKENEKE